MLVRSCSKGGRGSVSFPGAGGADPLDGLNKPLDDFDVTYYQQEFKRICYDQGSRRVEWNRPYITQVARFDPSKGMPDVLLSYRRLYHKFWDALDDKNLGAGARCGIVKSKSIIVLILGDWIVCRCAWGRIVGK